jgi:uncharacterized repeat protein (TIGR04076 family)
MKLMYSPGAGPSGRLVCPGGKVFFSVRSSRRYPGFLKPALSAFLRLVRLILRREAEIPEFSCRVTVDAVKGKCPACHAVGDSAPYNLFDRSVLCPASLHNVFPFLARPGEKVRTRLRIGCPDPGGAVYSVASGVTDVCGARDRALGFIPRSGGWPARPVGFCAAAFYSVFPYVRILKEGGTFGWLDPGEAVRIACPKPGGIVMEARAEGKGPRRGVLVRVSDLRDCCPAGMRKDAVFRKF